MTQTIEQLRWLGNYLADDAESKGIGQGSEGARYCFAGAKTIEQLQARVAELEAENARLKDEANHRYVEQVLSPVRRLLNVARCADNLADGVMDDGNGLHITFTSDFDEMSEALDALDELPDDKPGYTLSGPAKAAWALRDLIGDTNG